MVFRAPSNSRPFQRRRAVSEGSHSGIDVFLPVCLQTEHNVANTFGCREESRALEECVVNGNSIVRQNRDREHESAPVTHSRAIDRGIADPNLAPVDDPGYLFRGRVHEDMPGREAAMHQSRGDAAYFAGLDRNLEHCTELVFERIETDVSYNVDVTRGFFPYLV